MIVRAVMAGIAALCLAACGSDAPAAQGPDADTPAPPPIEEELPVMGPEVTILAFGDSLFAGYRLAEDEGYPERLEAALRAQGINARVIDAGVSGDTSAAGFGRIAYVLDNAPARPDLAIVELGGNDLLRGLPVEATRKNLSGIIEELDKRGIPVLLMGMRAPPNMGVEYQQAFDATYGELARQYDTALVPFFLEAIYDKPELIQADHIHPTAEGVQELVAATVGAVAAAIPEKDE